MRVRKGSLSYWLLFSLEKAIDSAVNLEDFTYRPYKYAQGSDIAPSFRRSSLSDAIRRLREAGYIEKEINENQVVLKLTSIGRDYLGVEEVWDGQYRIVMWDIPEKKRTVRNLFRRRLREWGFVNWQRSVWISKKNITEKLRKLVTELGLEDHIAIVESSDPTLARIKLNDRSR